MEIRKAIVSYKFSIILPLAIGILFILEAMKTSQYVAGGSGSIRPELGIGLFAVTNIFGFIVGFIVFFFSKPDVLEKYFIRSWGFTFVILTFLALTILNGQ